MMEIDDSFAESESLALSHCCDLAKKQPKCFEDYVRLREKKFVADKKPVCVLTGLREGGGARVGQKLWESTDRRLNSVVAAENCLWIVEFRAGKAAPYR